jgi:hypothetical protein
MMPFRYRWSYRQGDNSACPVRPQGHYTDYHVVAALGTGDHLLASSAPAAKFADGIFAVFVFLMMWILFCRMNIFAFLGLSLAFYMLGEALSHRIKLVPSFFSSLALAVFSIVLVWANENSPLIVATGN